MNRSRTVIGLFFLGAALCLGAIWLMWAGILASDLSFPPGAVGVAVLGTLFLSCCLAGGAILLVATAIRRLRRR
jgi:hypothetical protein